MAKSGALRTWFVYLLQEDRIQNLKQSEVIHKVFKRCFHPEITIAISDSTNCWLSLERMSHFLIALLYELYFHNEAFHS